QSAIDKVGSPLLRLNAIHNASGIMTKSAQIAMTRLSGPGISTVCRAKSPVVATVFEPKINLPDSTPRPATGTRQFRRSRGFSSLPIAQCTEFIWSVATTVANLQRVNIRNAPRWTGLTDSHGV